MAAVLFQGHRSYVIYPVFRMTPWANSADADQTPQNLRLISVYTVDHSSGSFLETCIGGKTDFFKI